MPPRFSFNTDLTFIKCECSIIILVKRWKGRQTMGQPLGSHWERVLWTLNPYPPVDGQMGFVFPSFCVQLWYLWSSMIDARGEIRCGQGSSKREWWDWKGPPPQQVSELRSVSFFLLIIHVHFQKLNHCSLACIHLSSFLQGIQVKSNCIPSYRIYRIDKSVPWRSPWCRKGQRCQKWYSTHTISAHVHGECGLLLCSKVCLKKNMSVGFQCQISFLTNSNIQPLWA